MSSNSKQIPYFWPLHVGGWSLWGIGKYYYSTATFETLPPYYMLYVATVGVVAMVISLGLRWLYHAVWDRPVWLRALAFIGGSAGTGWLWYQSRALIYGRYFQDSEEMSAYWEKMGELAELSEKVSYMATFSAALWMMLAWSTIYFALRYNRVFQDYRESALKSAAMAHEAQLKMLRYQLNPHFLFNTLNAISTLILEKQSESANRMVTKLSSFLRYSLDNDPMLKITLAQELKALKLYLDIEEVRFEDRLALDLDIEEGAERALIPSLLLQPLVENAIKFAIARSEEGGTLRIAARVFAGELLMEVRDDGPGVELVDGEIPGATGVGLRNTRERLQELYGQHHSFKLSSAEPRGLCINIRIPFETQQG